MATIAGILGLADSDRSFVSVIGQRTVYDAVNEYLKLWNDELNATIATFVETTTEDHKLRYYLPGGGRLQRLGGNAPAGDVKVTGSWDVSFPLEEFGRGLGSNRVGLAYMRLDEMQRHIQSITLADLGTMRFEILKALFNNTARTFVDPVWGSLTIQPLANADGTLYPPVIGSETEADDTHHIAPAYAASSISDTNDPFVTIVDELEEHFGATQGGSNIVVFINNAQWAKVRALADVNEISDNFLRLGANATLPIDIPPGIPGTLRGRHNKGCWISEYRWIPASYMLGIDLDAPKPLMERVDPADTNLPRGLTLVAESDMYPLKDSQYSHRFGIGCGNRLNGVFADMTDAAGTFAIPSGYS